MHRATILKDRSDLMNGKRIDNPTFKDFTPVIKALNLGGEHFVLDITRTSNEMIANPDYSYEDRRRAQTIFTEEIEGELVSAFPGQSTAEKKMKTDILDVVFQSRSWAKIKEYSPDLLKNGLKSVRYLCSALKSNGGVPEGEDSVAWLRGQLIRMDDDVPAFSLKAVKDKKTAA